LRRNTNASSPKWPVRLPLAAPSDSPAIPSNAIHMAPPRYMLRFLVRDFRSRVRRRSDEETRRSLSTLTVAALSQP
jgi:hypothetical protein